MVTYVGDSNLQYFSALLNADGRSLAGMANTLILGAIDDDGMGCGAICIDVTRYDANITSFFVVPEYRRRGHGSELLKRAMDIISDARPAVVTAFFEADETAAKELSGCLGANGFAVSADVVDVYSTMLGEMLSSKYIARSADSPQGVVPMSQISRAWVNKFNTRFADADRFIFDPIDLSRIDTDMSSAIVTNGEIEGVVLVSYEKGVITVDGLFSVSKNNLKLLPSALILSLRSAAKKAAPDTAVRFAAVNPSIPKIVKTLFPDGGFALSKMYAMSYEPAY